MENSFKTTHDLVFEAAPWTNALDPSDNWMVFRVGTCEGVWRSSDDNYSILAITNKEPGNGHFEDVLEWFENSCKRDGKNLMILEVWNDKFKKHLIEKRGFRVVPMTNHVVKDFKDRAYRIGRTLAVALLADEPLHAQKPFKDINDVIAETHTYKVTNIRKPLDLAVINFTPNPTTPKRTPRAIRREQERKNRKRR